MQIAPVRGPSFGEVRRYDGGHNNLEHPDWGQTDSVLLRLTPPVYADGEQAPSGDDRPNPREISNQILNERGRYLDPRNLSGMVWAWGQFVDHDITFTPAGSQEWNIAVPKGDVHFDPDATGTAVIPFHRSQPAASEPGEPRQQFNGITAWLDGSGV
ncbi:MAG: peroxidase, partial [Candidatus Eremiobacteraeota bacterium]|nr:peroxidase [Candidatus Eremiobacteraeota bacterium]